VKPRLQVIGLSAAMALAMGLFISGCTTVPPDAAAVGQLAPTGKLRAAIVLTSSLQVTQSSLKSTEVEGVAPDLGRHLARRLGVPLELVGYRTAAELMDSIPSQAWEVAFLGIDPARAEQLSFSEPYMEAGLTYLVRPGSPLQAAVDVDRPGVRVAVIAKSPSDLFLSRTLKHAELIRSVGGPDGAFGELAAGKAEALAGSHELLQRYLRTLPGSAIVSGNFTTLAQAIAVRCGQASLLAYVNLFLAEAKQAGVVTQVIERAHLEGVSVVRALAK
jgi:polar amino acid transport system substrate-binding protein